MTAAAKGSVSAPMLLTQSEATAAQRTVLFHLVKTADQADCTGVVPVVTLSKAGAAFGAAVGAVTEIALGWYKIVLDAADVGTLGQLAMHVEVATADSLDVVHQVVAFDLNVATVAIAAGGIAAAAFAAGAIDAAALATDAAVEIRTGLATAAAVESVTLATRTVVKDLGRVEEDGFLNTDGDLVAISVLDAIDAQVTISGTWDGATATVETCEDPAATVPLWAEYDDTLGDNPLTADGVIVVDGPHSAVRVTISDDGATTDLGVSVAIRKAANT